MSCTVGIQRLYESQTHGVASHSSTNEGNPSCASTASKKQYMRDTLITSIHMRAPFNALIALSAEVHGVHTAPRKATRSKVKPCFGRWWRDSEQSQAMLRTMMEGNMRDLLYKSRCTSLSCFGLSWVGCNQAEPFYNYTPYGSRFQNQDTRFERP